VVVPPLMMIGSAGQPYELRRRDRLGAAAHATQALLHVECSNIASDRRLGRFRQIDHLLHRHDRFFLDGRQDQAMALFFVHGSSLEVIYASPASSVNHFRSKFLIVQCNMIGFDRL
jgi:hypothetical protein